MLHPERHQDPRFVRSGEALSAAIWELASTTPINVITITMLTKLAQVSRPTFYQHAADVGELARNVAIARLSELTPMLPPFDSAGSGNPGHIAGDLADAILPALVHLAQHQRFYVNVLENAATPDLFKRVIALLIDRMDSGSFSRLAEKSGVTRDAIATVIHGGIMWRIVSWLQEKRTAEDARAFASEIDRIFSTISNPP